MTMSGEMGSVPTWKQGTVSGKTTRKIHNDELEKSLHYRVQNTVGTKQKQSPLCSCFVRTRTLL